MTTTTASKIRNALNGDKQELPESKWLRNPIRRGENTVLQDVLDKLIHYCLAHNRSATHPDTALKMTSLLNRSLPNAGVPLMGHYRSVLTKQLIAHLYGRPNVVN
jgi:hypothetical protein